MSGYKFTRTCFDLYFDKPEHEIIEEVLFERNIIRCKTFVTTNLTSVEISEKYAPRLGDRLPEMFNIIPWRGESFRK